MKKVLGLLLALAFLGGAAGGVKSVEKRVQERGRADAERAAVAARDRAADAIRAWVASLEIRASAASTLQPLLNQVTLLRQNRLEDVAKTLHDWFAEEPPWQVFREEFKVYGLSAEGDVLDLAMGLKPAEIDAAPLVRRARERGMASGTVMGKGWPYAAAAARLSVASLAIKPIVLLAKPFDDATMRAAADRAQAAVALSDGKRLLAAGGPPEDRDRLARAVGRETAGSFALPDGTWAAAAEPLAGGLWLWVSSGDASSRASSAALGSRKALVWGVAALAAAASLFFGFRPPRPATAAPTMTTGSAPAPAAGSPGATGSGALGAASDPAVSPFGSTMVASSAGGAPGGGSGRYFGRYLLLERLGEGGMSVVFTAVTFGAEGFRRKFVLKRLRPELSSDPAAVAQFTDEANLASSLVHSNIVPVFDFGRMGEEYFMATEYILGRDLGRLVASVMEQDHAPLAPALVLSCAHETLKALEYAHTRKGDGGRALGIVHRDVSPGNILISARGEVKLFDFGIVKAEGRVTKTEHGVVKGNVSFMSPEQARGLDTDARADLFSLGLVMFYTLTGDTLYHGATAYELLVKAATGPGVDEKTRIAGLPGPAAAIVARALEVDPARRFASAGEFAAAIAPHLAAGEAQLAELMERLFGAEFAAEEKRFTEAVPAQGGGSTPISVAVPRTTQTRRQS